MTKVLQIRTSFRCGRGCSFCATPSDPASRDLTLEEVRANVDFFVAARGVDELVFSGGEAGGGPDLEALLELVRERRDSLRLVTLISSGQGWTAERVRACAGLVDRVVVSATPRSASDLADPRSFTGSALDAARALRAAGLTVQTNTVMLPSNAALLAPLARRLVRLGVTAPTFTFPFPHGRVLDDPEGSVAPWTRLAPFLVEAVQIARPLGPRIKNLPLCYLGPLERLAPRTTARYLVQPGRQLERHAVIPPFSGVGHGPACEPCPQRPRCDGVAAAYLGLPGFPPLGFRPARDRGTRSAPRPGGSAPPSSPRGRALTGPRPGPRPRRQPRLRPGQPTSRWQSR